MAGTIRSGLDRFFSMAQKGGFLTGPCVHANTFVSNGHNLNLVPRVTKFPAHAGLHVPRVSNPDSYQQSHGFAEANLNLHHGDCLPLRLQRSRSLHPNIQTCYRHHSNRVPNPRRLSAFKTDLVPRALISAFHIRNTRGAKRWRDAGNESLLEQPDHTNRLQASHGAIFRCAK
jgi:hypothetical protein